MTPRTKHISLEELREKPYSLLVAYPSPSAEVVGGRVAKLGEMGVSRALLEGRTEICGLRILGKGCTATLILVDSKFGRAAAKILRTDADRKSLLEEARHLEAANSLGVGPRVYAKSDEILLMEYVEGETLEEFLGSVRRTSELRRVLKSLLDQSFALDRMGLYHGELSNPVKHVIVRASEAVIIDFESARMNPNRSNLTAVLQYIAISGRHAGKVCRLLKVDREGLVERLRRYKRLKTEEAYAELLAFLGLRAAAGGGECGVSVSYKTNVCKERNVRKVLINA